MASRALRRRATFRAINGHSKQRSRPLLKVLVVLLVGITMFTSGASAATIFFYGESLPSLHNFKSRFQFQNTRIMDRQGNLLYDLADLSRSHGERVVEPLSAPGHPTSYYLANHEDWLVGNDGYGIPTDLQNATVATEDATFYSNPGFDPLSIARAGYDNFTKGHVVSGGSTITQQLIKTYMLSPSPTLSRKTEELILAAELTQKYPKSKILWYYLNSVPYGNLSVGAQAAAQTYFHENVWKLDLAQCAFLAGLPEAPSTYNPVNNLPAAKARMEHVLALMYDHGYLQRPGMTKDEIIAQIMSETRKWHFAPPSTIKHFPHFVQFAIDQLQHIPKLSGKVYTGLDVYTTLNSPLEQQAQNIVHNQIGQLQGLNVTDGALVSMDVRRDCYGCILAMVGSADYNNVAIHGQIDMADSPRQPGSSFKAFNYAYAFSHGLSPATTVLDGPLAIPDQGNPDDGGWYEPTNYDHLWHGVVTLRVALQNSLNIPAVKVEQYNATEADPQAQGVRATVGQLAHDLGITSLFADNPHCCGWSLTLGGLEKGVRLVQETSAYGAIATGGVTVPPLAIYRVYDRTTHKLLYDGPAENWKAAHRVLDASDAYVLTNVLSDDASRCTPQVCEFGPHSDLWLGRAAAAKTGTTNAFTDNWTVGYTPQIVTGVWVGNADFSAMVNSTGITGAAPIWHDFMLSAIKTLRLAPRDFTQPPGVYFGSECRQQSSYGFSLSSFSYDLYAHVVPICSVGTYDTTLPVPPPDQSSEAPVIPAAPAAPVQPAAPAAPTQAPVVPTQPAAPPAPAPTAAVQVPVAQPTVAAPPVGQSPAVQPTP